MKKLLLSLCMAAGVLAAEAQTTATTNASGNPVFNSPYRKRPTLGLNFVLNDFNTAMALRRTDLGTVLNNKQVSSIREMNWGLGLQYIEGLSDHIDFSSQLQASFLRYPIPGRALPNSDRLLLEADMGVNVKLLSDRYFFSPYLSAGIGASMWGKTFGAYIPMGAGFQFRLSEEEGTFLNTGLQYRIGVTDNTQYHLNYTFGVVTALTKRIEPKVIAPPPPPPPPPAPMDTDKDGIVDQDDKCPTVAGTAKYNGCPIPDSDNDGVNDENDACPNQAGLAKYKGCPIPDSDRDGINDEEDRCPNQAGTARYNGCPIPDTDGDGVNDEVDKCPNEAGDAVNNGCPLKSKQLQASMDSVAGRLFFATGSSKLTAKSNPGLMAAYTMLKNNPELGLDIEGHTDNVGKPANNLKLSKARAAAVRAWLLKKGISANRMTSQGFGDSKPRADNKTAAGRAQNRRTTMRLREL